MAKTMFNVEFNKRDLYQKKLNQYQIYKRQIKCHIYQQKVKRLQNSTSNKKGYLKRWWMAKTN